MNQCPDLFVDLRREVLRHSGKGGIGTGIGGAVPADEPVGDVDVVDPVLLGAVLLEEVGHFDAQLREFRSFLAPGLVAVDVREGGDGTALEDVEPSIELGLAAGGEPEEFGDESGADDGGLLRFDEGHGLLGEEGQQVFAEEALAELPILGKLAGVFHQGVHPGDAAFGVLVFDAVAGFGVVLHHFAGAYAALGVDLVEDDGTVTCDAEAVFIDQAFEDDRVEEGGEEAGEVAMDGGTQGLCHDLGRYGVHLVHLSTGVYGWTGVDAALEPLRGLAPVFGVWPGLRMVPEVFPGRVVVVAGGFVVASANGLVQEFSFGVDVAGEGVLCAAVGAGVAACRAGVALQGVVVVVCIAHGLLVFWGEEVVVLAVHLVHLVHSVHRLFGGGRFVLLDDFGDHGLGKADFLGDFPVGFALAGELDDVLDAVQGLGLFLLAEVLTLGGVLLEFEVGEAVGFLDLVDDDVVGVVTEGSGADLELFDVAQALVFGRFADGEDAVEEIVEFLGAGEVVLGDGAGEGALGRVGDNQDRPAVLLLELHQFHHEEAGIYAFVAAVAEVGEVVDDDDGAVELECCGFDVLEDAVFVVFEVQVHVVDLGPVHPFRELVEEAGDFVSVAELELLFGELAVEVEDAVVAGDDFGDLDGVEGLAQVGVREEAGDLALVPQFEEEGHRVGHFGGVLKGVVDLLDGQHADGVGVCISFHCRGDGVNGIEGISCLHPCGS